MGNEVVRRLALMAGNGAILVFIAQIAFVENTDAMERMAFLAAPPLLGMVCAYMALVLKDKAVSDLLEGMAAVMFLSMPLLWVVTGILDGD